MVKYEFAIFGVAWIYAHLLVLAISELVFD